MDKREDWPISGINIAVSKIEILNKDKSIEGCATGFFFSNNEKKYLITNRHVVIDEVDNFYPSYLRLRLHTSKTKYNENCTIDISLYDNSSKNWLEHSEFTVKKVDVVAIPLTIKTVDDFNAFNH
ncbi:MAG TPA: hypothetical protein PLN06_05820 [Bacteroidales bacterium]|nr:hypothetical protein [Bacteroidales bacterium]HCI54948.1 hypothetical protein [Bacteroidales bacterium]HOU96130.1 hypothetical protein [Bacteroidales bacterium]HQG37188.1 hypothetical protein [Bacteroidales bacterium]HQG53435.1 hypothetical protein [Bacteroidales bacterium]